MDPDDGPYYLVRLLRAFAFSESADNSQGNPTRWIFDTQDGGVAGAD